MKHIALDLLQLDPDIQPRAAMSKEAITEYAELYQSIGAEALPPIDVFAVGDGYLVAEGFHRVLAARRAELDALPATVRQGDRDDALLFAAGANQGYGVRRSNKDKRLIVERVLKSERWAAWSDRQIAKHVGVSNRLVSTVRHTVNGSQYDDKQRTFVHPKTGTPATMNTANIGKAHEEEGMAATETLILKPAPFVELPQAKPPPAGAKRSTFNRTNEMVEWAWWTWNPVTGCLHDCAYCYARDIANRYYPEKFEPTFRPERLGAPYYTKLPDAAETQIGARNVFVCSMADLFGKWVPQEWIDAVLDVCRASPQWNFLFLTKFPQRLDQIDWPTNAWVGTTVDTQDRVKIAERHFKGVNAPVRWLSCEPLLADLTFSSLEMFDWVVIGGQSRSTRTPEFQPPWAWVEHLMQQARAAGCMVYFKQNLKTAPKEYPHAT